MFRFIASQANERVDIWNADVGISVAQSLGNVEHSLKSIDSESFLSQEWALFCLAFGDGESNTSNQHKKHQNFYFFQSVQRINLLLKRF
jgi:hypothetical protein